MKQRMHGGATKFFYQKARELRNNLTNAESLLWAYLKTKPWGLKFRRQHPYSIYILDFYCHFLKLVIEVDGRIHEQAEIKIKDKERQDQLENDGLIVIRFTNEEIEKKFEEVHKTIEKFVLKNKDD